MFRISSLKTCCNFVCKERKWQVISGKSPFFLKGRTPYFMTSTLKGKRKTKSCGGKGTWQCMKIRIIRYSPPKGEESQTQEGFISQTSVTFVSKCVTLWVDFFCPVWSGQCNEEYIGFLAFSYTTLQCLPPNRPSFSILVSATSVELQSAHHLTAFTKYLVYRLPIIRNFLCESDVSY